VFNSQVSLTRRISDAVHLAPLFIQNYPYPTS